MTKRGNLPEFVTVEVVVNHDDLRRGERGEVELTETVRGRLDKGYLRLVDGDEAEVPAARSLGATADRGLPVAGTLLGVDGSASVVPLSRGGNSDQGRTVHATDGPGTR